MDNFKESLKSIDKKTLKVALIGVIVLIVLILMIVIIVRLTEKNYYSYTEFEEKLVEAAQNYYKDNSSYLPVLEKSTSTVTLNSLVVGEYILPIEEMLKDGDKCTAQVVVTKLEANYDYTPYLDCGEAYNSIELFNKVLEDNAVVTEGVGLYNENNEYVFKGEVKNNYIKLNDQSWRILRIDKENSLVLLSEFRTNNFTWDNRYNEDTKSNYGINNYNLSRIKERIEEEYYSDKLLTEKEKSKLVSTYWCLGSRNLTDTGTMEEVECKEHSEEESVIGLLTVYEYLQASLDPNCNTIEDRGCTNYNFIHDMKTSFWTITKGVKSTSHAYNITTSGIVESRTNVSKQVRYVIKLGPKAIYLEGSGTQEDPYKIR